MVAPGDDIRDGNIVGQLDVGRRNDRLMTVVRFGRHGKDRLLCELRLSFERLGHRRPASRVERRQIFLGRVVNHVGRIETADLDRALGAHEESGISPGEDEHDSVIEDGFGKCSPRQAVGDKDVGPEGSGRGTDSNFSDTAPKQKIGQILTKGATPRLEFDDKTRGLGGTGARLGYRSLGCVFQS